MLCPKVGFQVNHQFPYGILSICHVLHGKKHHHIPTQIIFSCVEYSSTIDVSHLNHHIPILKQPKITLTSGISQWPLLQSPEAAAATSGLGRGIFDGSQRSAGKLSEAMWT